jgi:hypothetical protein
MMAATTRLKTGINPELHNLSRERDFARIVVSKLRIRVPLASRLLGFAEGGGTQSVKRLTVFVAMLLFATTICLAEQWSGWITDQKCAASGKYAGTEHRKCVESGAAVVFVNDADKKIYMVSDPDKVKAHIGEKVTLQGTAKGETLEVETVEATPPAQH